MDRWDAAADEPFMKENGGNTNLQTKCHVLEVKIMHFTLSGLTD
jgi:hypothetical protein